MLIYAAVKSAVFNSGAAGHALDAGHDDAEEEVDLQAWARRTANYWSTLFANEKMYVRYNFVET